MNLKKNGINENKEISVPTNHQYNLAEASIRSR
jgi:hypothetical protein